MDFLYNEAGTEGRERAHDPVHSGHHNYFHAIADGVYLSYAQLKEYLTVLTENELICYDAGQSEYKTTEKGFKFLRVYDQMSGLTSETEVLQSI
jgi:predicted transcriptional regulator